MYRILVVDDDQTCLNVARACLRRCNYEVTAVTHALQALSLLDEKCQGERSYDVILADVHMPQMDGIQLLRHVNKKFDIPVVLISADNRSDVVTKGFMNGAPAYLFKPVTTVEVKHLWQYSVLWKNREKNAYRRFIGASIPRNICSSSSGRDSKQVSSEMKAKDLVWTPDLHNRFVEAILILGCTNAPPKEILKAMNVPSINRLQVASHLQKFKKFLKELLDGETELGSKYWIDCNYYSEIVGGNPNVILLDQLRELRRSCKAPAPIPASLPLPPLNISEASSSTSRNAVALNYHNVVPQQDYGTFHSAVNGGLMGVTNSSIFPSTNHMVPFIDPTPIHNDQFIFEQPFNMDLEGNNIPLDENDLNNDVMQIENEQPINPNTGSSVGVNHFDIPLAMNNEQAWVQSVQFSTAANEFGNVPAMPMNQEERRF
ncbi:hypothetical protein POM88_012824 [Heracleum sosnowskyi]|uniref:Response regulatory domain-containing protein n=1 Tax=Heracleum sosnowskyi TaxID=360622 RepID=A0AAD8N3S2_9APIA|nr:hypothetical protein POM88_012824 [Heracleum sosnowskyi]